MNVYILTLARYLKKYRPEITTCAALKTDQYFFIIKLAYCIPCVSYTKSVLITLNQTSRAPSRSITQPAIQSDDINWPSTTGRRFQSWLRKSMLYWLRSLELKNKLNYTPLIYLLCEKSKYNGYFMFSGAKILNNYLFMSILLRVHVVEHFFIVSAYEMRNEMDVRA